MSPSQGAAAALAFGYFSGKAIGVFRKAHPEVPADEYYG